MQNTEVWGVVLVLFAWFCFGFDFFTVKQRKWGDKGGSARILLCIHDTTLPVQLRGSKDWGLQLIIFLLGSHEEMGPNYPSKCLMFYEAFTALHILTVFYCCFTNSGFKKVNADHNCCLAWKKYPTCLFLHKTILIVVIPICTSQIVYINFSSKTSFWSDPSIKLTNAAEDKFYYMEKSTCCDYILYKQVTSGYIQAI